MDGSFHFHAERTDTDAGNNNERLGDPTILTVRNRRMSGDTDKELRNLRTAALRGAVVFCPEGKRMNARAIHSPMMSELIDKAKRSKKQTERDNRYKNSRWWKLRLRVLERDHFECQVCASVGGYSRAAEVHHILPAESFRHLFYQEDNLVSLCRDCHDTVHNRGYNGVESAYPEFI